MFNMHSKTSKRDKFKKIVKDIKDVKIQGAGNIAKKALYAYSLIPKKRSKKKLLSLRPTEPLLQNVLDRIEKQPYNEIMQHFRESQEKINKFTLKLIKNNDVIFTHCHSSTVNEALAHAKKKGKKFEVYATETRPLFQGRRTVRDLRKAGIKTTLFVDSAAMVALTKRQGTKKVDKFFLGADALLQKGIINKIGSGMLAHIAKENKIPLYILSDSWKFSSEKVRMEQRTFREIWKKSPSGTNIKNPAFEIVPKKDIKSIVSEFGILGYGDFLKRVRRQ